MFVVTENVIIGARAGGGGDIPRRVLGTSQRERNGMWVGPRSGDSGSQSAWGLRLSPRMELGFGEPMARRSDCHVAPVRGATVERLSDGEGVGAGGGVEVGL